MMIMVTINKNELDEFIRKKKANVLICSSSFEDRCFAVVDSIKDMQFDKLFVFRVPDLDHRIIVNSKLFASKISYKKLKFINLKIHDVTSSFFAIRDSLLSIFQGNDKNIVVDITTFTHEGLLILFRLMMELKRPDDKFTFVYNGASDYSCNKEIKEEKWLTKGVRNVRSIIGYSGVTEITKENHLIVLFGFELERTRRLIDYMDFEHFSLAYGLKNGSVANEHQIINEERHKQLMQEYPEQQGKVFNISLTNPMDTKNEILEYVSKLKNQNVVIAPMNNKISTIGAGLAAMENKSIQLTYLQPNTYNFDGYSKAGEVFYVWELN